jgi:aspartate/methionine/tyrosine aminotransferase
MFGEPGAEILYPNPGFPIYQSAIEFSGATAVPIPLYEDSGFSFSAEEVLSKITPRTRLIMLNSPANPTGGVTGKAEIDRLVEGLEAYPDIAIMSDEIYSRLLYDGQEHVSLLGYPSIRERVILLDGWSKTYAMTGWRIGYMVVPRDIAPVLANLQEAMISCASTPGQWAALAALEGPQEVVAEMRGAYAARRQLALDVLGKHGVPAHPPDGAFYLWIDIRGAGVPSRTFARTLLDAHGVAVVPGLDFGSCGEGYVRVSLAAAPEALSQGLDRLGQYYASLVGDAGTQARRARL